MKRLRPTRNPNVQILHCAVLFWVWVWVWVCCGFFSSDASAVLLSFFCTIISILPIYAQPIHHLHHPIPTPLFHSHHSISLFGQRSSPFSSLLHHYFYQYPLSKSNNPCHSISYLIFTTIIQIYMLGLKLTAHNLFASLNHGLN